MKDLIDIVDALPKYDDFSLMEELRLQITQLPQRGTPAADLSEQEKFALAYHAGARYASDINERGWLTFRTTDMVGIADRGDGGYIVAIRRAPPPAREHKYMDPW